MMWIDNESDVISVNLLECLSEPNCDNTKGTFDNMPDYIFAARSNAARANFEKDTMKIEFDDIVVDYSSCVTIVATTAWTGPVASNACACSQASRTLSAALRTRRARTRHTCVGRLMSGDFYAGAKLFGETSADFGFITGSR